MKITRLFFSKRLQFRSPPTLVTPMLTPARAEDRSSIAEGNV